MKYQLRFILSNNNIEMLSIFHMISHILFNFFKLIFTQINFVHKYDTLVFAFEKIKSKFFTKNNEAIVCTFL